jgi:hypothetical protein
MEILVGTNKSIKERENIISNTIGNIFVWEISFLLRQLGDTNEYFLDRKLTDTFAALHPSGL